MKNVSGVARRTSFINFSMNTRAQKESLSLSSVGWETDKDRVLPSSSRLTIILIDSVSFFSSNITHHVQSHFLLPINDSPHVCWSSVELNFEWILRRRLICPKRLLFFIWGFSPQFGWFWSWPLSSVQREIFSFSTSTSIGTIRRRVRSSLKHLPWSISPFVSFSLRWNCIKQPSVRRRRGGRVLWTLLFQVSIKNICVNSTGFWQRTFSIRRFWSRRSPSIVTSVSVGPCTKSSPLLERESSSSSVDFFRLSSVRRRSIRCRMFIRLFSVDSDEWIFDVRTYSSTSRESFRSILSRVVRRSRREEFSCLHSCRKSSDRSTQSAVHSRESHRSEMQSEVQSSWVIRSSDGLVRSNFFLELQFSNYVLAYRLFHSLLFVACLLLVLFFYGCIYKAIYQRRLTRTRKLSTYQKVLRSYLIDSDHLGRSSPSRWICSRLRRTKRSEHRTDIEEEEQNESNQRLTRANPPEQIVLEMHRARGKRYSAVSMTSMTYLTSGVWDDTASSANLLRSRISSVTATTFCGTEQRSTSTEESFEQTTHKPLQNKASTTSHSTHLTVPGQCQATISLVNDPSSVRSTPRISDGSIQQRKVSFSTSLSVSLFRSNRRISSVLSTLISERSVVEDCPLFEQRIAEGGDERRNASISSTRRLSTFDAETERIFERQQRQERLANIRTTLTLFIVTATFILMYLPSIVIILFDIKPHEFREIFFLLYYINSAVSVEKSLPSIFFFFFFFFVVVV